MSCELVQSNVWSNIHIMKSLNIMYIFNYIIIKKKQSAFDICNLITLSVIFSMSWHKFDVHISVMLQYTPTIHCITETKV